MQRAAFQTAAELSSAIDDLFAEFPVALYYGLDTVAPFPDFQSHDGYEFYYVWQGRGTYIAGNDAYALEAGTLMPIRPRMLHKVLQTEAAHPVCRHVLLLREDWFRREGLAGVLPEEEGGFRFGAPLAASGAERDTADFLYRSIHEELTSKKAGFEHAVAGYVKALLAQLRRFGAAANAEGRAVPAASPHLPPEVVYLLQHVGAGFQSPLSLSDLAHKVHMNPNYVSQLFHRHTGYTLRQFVAMKRMHHGRNLLRDTALPVHIIAAECGYNDASHFIRVFRSAYGCTPQAYRAAAAAKEEPASP